MLYIYNNNNNNNNNNNHNNNTPIDYVLTMVRSCDGS